jgi:betaine reductase
MVSHVKVVHYLNQFFGGIGDEEQANSPVEARQGVVGPGRALQQVLGGDGTVVATIIAGDNYVVEETDAAMQSVREILRQYRPDVVIAGPAFEAGRYGLACAEICRQAQAQGLPAVTGMFPDNPGVLAYRQNIICVPTGESVSEMVPALGTMSALAVKLARGGALGTAAEEGYLPRGIRKPLMREKTGAQRAADILKARLENQPYVTEVYLKEYDVVAPPEPLRRLEDATFALLTTGAVIPKGNPDNMPTRMATTFYRYSIEGLNDLPIGEWESIHAGFNTAFINTQNPNYAMPVKAARVLESTGEIGALLPYFISTPGVATAVNDSRRFGTEVAEELHEAGVDAALLVAT